MVEKVYEKIELKLGFNEFILIIVRGIKYLHVVVREKKDSPLLCYILCYCFLQK